MLPTSHQNPFHNLTFCSRRGEEQHYTTFPFPRKHIFTHKYFNYSKIRSPRKSLSTVVMMSNIFVSANTCEHVRPRFIPNNLYYSHAYPCNNRYQNTSGRRGRLWMMSSSTNVMEAATKTTSQNLRKGIAEFYDESSGLWENIWGDHMHHGYYQPGSDVSLFDHRAAQIRMIEEALSFASINDESVQKPKNVVDVGCGIGGSSRYLARKYGAKCRGITLSPVQAQRAQELAAAQGLNDKVSFQVADALNQPFPDGEFDLVWSMESGEHMPDKAKFVNELARVASPGGTIIIVTWCHRDLSPGEKSLNQDEKDLLNKICQAFYLPEWCSTADYVKLLSSISLEDIKAEDWSQYVAPFWPAVIKSALTWKGMTSLLRAGWKTIKGAFAMPLMMEGYKKGLIKFAIITCKKPIS